MNEGRAPDDTDCWSKGTSHETNGTLRWRRFDQAVMEAREQFRSFQADELQAIIDEAVTASRWAP